MGYFVLEFSPQMRKEQSCNVNCFHYNSIRDNGMSLFFCNNYYPLAIFSDEEIGSREFNRFLTSLEKIGERKLLGPAKKMSKMYGLIPPERNEKGRGLFPELQGLIDKVSASFFIQ